MNPFLQAVEAMGSAVVQHGRSAAGEVTQYVNTQELLKVAVDGALAGLPGGPVGAGSGAIAAILVDLPNIATPQDQVMFAAGLKLAEEIAQAFRSAPVSTSAPAS